MVLIKINWYLKLSCELWGGINVVTIHIAQETF